MTFRIDTPSEMAVDSERDDSRTQQDDMRYCRQETIHAGDHQYVTSTAQSHSAEGVGTAVAQRVCIRR